LMVSKESQAPSELPMCEAPILTSCPYSPECVEGEFCELPLYGVLGNS
jgi:hypothetical protein